MTGKSLTRIFFFLCSDEPSWFANGQNLFSAAAGFLFFNKELQYLQTTFANKKQ